MGKLVDLYETLQRFRKHGYTRVGYRFTLTSASRPLEFEALLIADGSSPHELFIGLVGQKKPWAHVYSVEEYGTYLYTDGFLGDDYGSLMDALGFAGLPGSNKFPVGDILTQADRASASQQPRRIAPHEYPANYRRDVEEADKKYFMGWVNNNPVRCPNAPTKNNYEKTGRLIGWDVARKCRATHVSSRWTDDQTLAVAIDLSAF